MDTSNHNDDPYDFSLTSAFCWALKQCHDFYIKNTYNDLLRHDDGVYGPHRFDHDDFTDGLGMTMLSPLFHLTSNYPSDEMKKSGRVLAATGAVIGACLGTLYGDGTLPVLLGGGLGTWAGGTLPYTGAGLKLMGHGALVKLSKPFAAAASNHKELIDQNAGHFQEYLDARKEKKTEIKETPRFM